MTSLSVSGCVEVTWSNDVTHHYRNGANNSHDKQHTNATNTTTLILRLANRVTCYSRSGLELRRSGSTKQRRHSLFPLFLFLSLYVFSPIFPFYLYSFCLFILICMCYVFFCLPISNSNRYVISSSFNILSFS